MLLCPRCPRRSLAPSGSSSILLGGLAGGLIGWAFVDLQCTGDCRVGAAFGALVGAVGAALGTAVIAVLVLRAMGEWRQLGDRP